MEELKKIREAVSPKPAQSLPKVFWECFPYQQEKAILTVLEQVEPVSKDWVDG